MYKKKVMFQKTLSVFLCAVLLLSSIVFIFPLNAHAAVPQWADNTTYQAGDLVTYEGKTYKCLMGHTSNMGWIPSAAFTLWELQESSVTPSVQPTATAISSPTNPPVFYGKVSGYINPDLTSSNSSIKAGFKVEVLSYPEGSAVTDNNGYFEITRLPASEGYSLKISKANYLPQTIHSIPGAVIVQLGTSGSPVSMWAGDANNDSVINMADVMEFAKVFNSIPGDGKYNSDLDITKDNAINMADIMIVTKHFNQSSSNYPSIEIISATPTKNNSPSPTNTYTPTPTPTGNTNSTWGQKVYAPYVDVMLWPTFSINDCFDKTGQKYYTLAFITSNGGNPAWGGVTSINDNFYMDEINNIRSKGGDVIVSFGGANGTELAAANTDVATLQAKYQSVIDKYNLTWIDFDIEGAAVSDRASIDRRNKAVKGLEAANPKLTVAYCLPVLPSGLTSEGEYVLQNAKDNGVRIDAVNVMTMDFGSWAAPNPDGKMGDYAIQAGQNTYNLCQKIGLNTKIGITPMIGVNDVTTEKFYQADATKVLNFAQSTSWMRLIAMWSANRDNGKGGALYASSQIPQADFDFVNIFKAYK